MRDNEFLKGTVILTVSGVVVKILSAAYRIPLTRMIGAQGMGRYTAAFNFFMPFFSLATAGITPTVSRFCATADRTAKGDILSIYRKARMCFGLTALLRAAASLICAWFYAGYIDSPMIFTGVALICPNLIFAAFEAIYKGISQGTLNMAVSAKAAVLESSAKTVIGVCSVYLAGMLVKENRETAQLICAFATVSISGFICMVYMSSDFGRAYRTGEKSSLKITAGALFSMAVPISLSALVVSLSNFTDTVICLSIVKGIPDSRLMGAYPFISFTAVEEKAIWLFGVYQGMCLSIVNLIPSLSAAIGASGLPVLTKAVNGGGDDIRRQIDRQIKLTAALVVPLSMFVCFYPQQVITTLYGYDGARTVLASRFLGVMAPVAVLSAFSFPFNSILHAVGKSNTILKILAVACTVKVGLSVRLCSIGRVNIMGCIISQIVFHTLVFVLSTIAVKSVYPAKNILSHILYPAMLSYVLLTFMRSLSDFLLDYIPVELTTLFCGGLFLLIYLPVLVFTGFFIDKNRSK